MCIKPYSYEEVSMIDHLGVVLFYQESFFSENLSMNAVDVNDPINKWDDECQHHLFHEVLQLMDFK